MRFPRIIIERYCIFSLVSHARGSPHLSAFIGVYRRPMPFGFCPPRHMTPALSTSTDHDGYVLSKHYQTLYELDKPKRRPEIGTYDGA